MLLVNWKRNKHFVNKGICQAKMIKIEATRLTTPLSEALSLCYFCIAVLLVCISPCEAGAAHCFGTHEPCKVDYGSWNNFFDCAQNQTWTCQPVGLCVCVYLCARPYILCALCVCLFLGGYVCVWICVFICMSLWLKVEWCGGL